MKKIIIVLFLFLSITAPCSASLLKPAVIGNISESADAVGGKSYDTAAQPFEVVASVLNVLLSLLGIFFAILIIKSGFDWMSAEGDAGKIKTAKERIQHAIIGLVIVVSAYSITTFIFNSLPDTGGSGSTQTTNIPG